MYVSCVHTWCWRSAEEVLDPCSWSYNCSGATKWVLGTEQVLLTMEAPSIQLDVTYFKCVIQRGYNRTVMLKIPRTVVVLLN